MIIDMHAHVGDFRISSTEQIEPMTWESLIARLDNEGIDKAVFLPVYNASPEGAPLGIYGGDRMSVRDQVIDAERFRERIIPFANMDPRWGENGPSTDFSDILHWFQEHGCKGVGEVTANLPFDDPRVINMFKQVGARGMLVTIESTGFIPGAFGLQDDPGSPRLERLLRAAPETVIIGHGPGFWAEIGPVVSPQQKNDYPKGPISKDGSLARLLRQYSNLYADISACSGFNALTRDPDYGVRFINEFQDKLLFGTDLISTNPRARMQQRSHIERLIEGLVTEGRIYEEVFDKITWHVGLMPQLDYLKRLGSEGRISQKVFDKITWDNAAHLLGGL